MAAVEASITKLMDEFRVQPFIHRVEHSLHIRLVQLLGEWEHHAHRQGPGRLLADVAGADGPAADGRGYDLVWMKSRMVYIRLGPPGAAGRLEHRMAAVRRVR